MFKIKSGFHPTPLSSVSSESLHRKMAMKKRRSRKGAKTHRNVHWIAVTRWENGFLPTCASSLRLRGFA